MLLLLILVRSHIFIILSQLLLQPHILTDIDVLTIIHISERGQACFNHLLLKLILPPKLCDQPHTFLPPLDILIDIPLQILNEPAQLFLHSIILPYGLFIVFIITLPFNQILFQL